MRVRGPAAHDHRVHRVFVDVHLHVIIPRQPQRDPPPHLRGHRRQQQHSDPVRLPPINRPGLDTAMQPTVGLDQPPGPPPCQLKPSPIRLCHPVTDSPGVQLGDGRAHGEHINGPPAEDQKSPLRVRVAHPSRVGGVSVGHEPAPNINATQAVPS